VKCSFCGYEFDPADGTSACGGCPLVKGCHLLRCPRCGYEMPPEAKLLRWWRMKRRGPLSEMKQKESR
jgi:rubredoxin